MNTFPRRIALRGSTGSIGRQTLDVVRRFPNQFRVVALAARSNVEMLAQQVQEFQPSLVTCFADTPSVEEKARELLPGVVIGEQGLLEGIRLNDKNEYLYQRPDAAAIQQIKRRTRLKKTNHLS